jgi:hypothetical protein
MKRSTLWIVLVIPTLIISQNGPQEKLMKVAGTRHYFWQTQTQAENKATMANVCPPNSSWTAAIQSGRRNARRNQSHQRTQGNVLWQHGGCGQLWG